MTYDTRDKGILMNTKDTRHNPLSYLKAPGQLCLSPCGIFIITCVIIGILYFVLKDSAFLGYPKLTDLIIDNIVLGGSNKTGEWNLFWALTWIGCFICLFLFILSGRIFKSEAHQTDQRSFSKIPRTELAVFLPAVIQTVLYAHHVRYLWLFSFVFFIILLIYKESAPRYISVYLFLYFDLQLIDMICSFLSLPVVFNDLLLFFIPTVLLAAAVLIRKTISLSDSFIHRIFFALQLPLPFLCLLYLKSTYQYQGETVKLQLPIAYRLSIFLLIVILYISVFFTCFRKKHLQTFSVMFSSVASVFLYGSFISAAQIVPTDMHHYGEQMLPYMQLVDFSMKAYTDYSPVSGFFPMIPGFFNAVLFHGKATTFYAAFALTMILFALLTIYLIGRHAGGFYALIFAFLFHMPVYCRTWIILPVLLFLTLPAVTKNKRRFLYTYVLCGFLSGLYYPLFGLAIICAGLPYACACLYLYLKEKTLPAECKKPAFYIETLGLLIPIAVSIPLLIRMAGHVLAYSHQTIPADGLSLSAINVPDWFIPYLNTQGFISVIRNALYYAIRFISPMAFMWITLLLLCVYIRKNYSRKQQTLHAFVSPAFFLTAAAFILLPVCYTYTLVIMDESWVCRLFSRSGHIYLWVFGALLPILCIRYGNSFFSSGKSRNLFMMLCLYIGLMPFSTMRDYQFPVPDGTTNADSSVIGEYTANFTPFTLSDEMTLISDDNRRSFNRLGSGFIDQSTLSALYDYQNRLAILKFADPDVQVMGLNSLQLYYFLLDEKAPYSGKVSLAKSYEASKDVCSSIDIHTAIGSDIKPLNNYYLYRYLMDQGYRYDALTQFYLPRELFVALYDEEAYEKADLTKTPFSSSVYLAKAPAVLAADLSGLTTTLEASDRPDDFLEVTLDPSLIEKQLNIAPESGTILCVGFGKGTDNTSAYGNLYIDYEQGHWIIPLGINESYCEHPNDELYLSVYTPDDTEQDNLSVPLKDVCQEYHFYQLSQNRRLP